MEPPKPLIDLVSSSSSSSSSNSSKSHESDDIIVTSSSSSSSSSSSDSEETQSPETEQERPIIAAPSPPLSPPPTKKRKPPPPVAAASSVSSPATQHMCELYDEMQNLSRGENQASKCSINQSEGINVSQQRIKQLEEKLRRARQRTKDFRARNRQLKSDLSHLQIFHEGYKEATSNTQKHLTEKLERLLDRLAADGHVNSSSNSSGGGGNGGNGGLGEGGGEPLSISRFPSDSPHHFSISNTREDIEEGLLAPTQESPLTALPPLAMFLPGHEQPHTQQQEQQEQQRQEREQQQPKQHVS